MNSFFPNTEESAVMLFIISIVLSIIFTFIVYLLIHFRFRKIYTIKKYDDIKTIIKESSRRKRINILAIIISLVIWFLSSMAILFTLNKNDRTLKAYLFLIPSLIFSMLLLFFAPKILKFFSFDEIILPQQFRYLTYERRREE